MGIVLSSVLLLSLVGCGGSEKSENVVSKPKVEKQTKSEDEKRLLKKRIEEESKERDLGITLKSIKTLFEKEDIRLICF